jgi:hypothetical protein
MQNDSRTEHGTMLYLTEICAKLCTCKTWFQLLEATSQPLCQSTALQMIASETVDEVSRVFSTPLVWAIATWCRPKTGLHCYCFWFWCWYWCLGCWRCSVVICQISHLVIYLTHIALDVCYDEFMLCDRQVSLRQKERIMQFATTGMS